MGAEAALLFTDIEGSTQLLRDLGDDYETVLRRHQVLVREAIAAAGGVEAGSEGDGFFAVFDRPAEALVACVRAQRALAAEPWPAHGVVRVRMGVHLGDVRRGGEQYVGLGVHQAARVAPAAHGGQVIISAAMAAAVGHALPEQTGLLDLGAFHLRDFDGPQHLFQLLHPDLETSFPPPRVASAAVHNLAPPRTSFVGRTDLLEELVKLTEVAQLVTVVGPGGVGKTRLASEVGLRVADRYPAGVWLVSLASIDRSGAVAEQVKTAMGLLDLPGRTATEVVADRFSSGAGLLLLDNCEHVLDGCVELVEELLAALPTLRVLATSREHLGMLGEEVIRLGPLDLPAPGDPVVAGYGAIDLFVARAAQASRGFALTEANSAMIGALCARLDGIPLALELAAPRLATMSVSQLYQRLDDALEGLGASRRGGVDRQRTLRATLDWSHRLLHPAEQEVFRALSVFRDGFTLDAAATVLASALSAAGAVEQGVDHLVAQSLVEFEPAAEPPRYRLLQTIRAYAHEQLGDPVERALLEQRHAAYFGALAHDCAQEGDTAEALDRLAADHSNLLLAADQLAGDGPVEHGQLLLDLSSFWDVRGHWQLARQHYLAYLARPDRDRGVEGRLLRLVGMIAVHLGDLPAARERFDEALVLARALSDRELESRCVGNLGAVALHQRDLPAAKARYEEALGLARELGDRQLESTCVGNLGAVARSLGDLPAARARYEEALGIARQLGNRRSESLWLGNIGVIAMVLGDYSAAQAHYEDALAIARELGDRLVEVASVSNLALVAVRSADLASAHARYLEAVGIARELGDRSLEAERLGNLGVVAERLGDRPATRAWLEQSLALARELGDRRLESAIVTKLGVTELALGDLRAARGRYEAALAIDRDLGDRSGEGAVLHQLGAIALDLGDAAHARARLSDALGVARELGEESSDLIADCARLLAQLDRFEDAAHLLAAAGALADTTREESEQARYDATLALCREHLDDATFSAAWRSGEALDATAALDRAQQALGVSTEVR